MAAPPGVVPPGTQKKVKPPKGQPMAMVPGMPGALPRPGVVPHLMFVNGPRAGERIPLKHGFIIGKAPTCDLVIEDGYTSTHHAQIGLDPYGNARLYDAGSTNGTFVNGVRVTELVLEHGISIRIGSTELRFLAQ
jgi:pSer/pThr/pTyr-binding forkhead associated (FHA) protein